MNLDRSREEIIENIEKIIKEKRFGMCCGGYGSSEERNLEFNLAIGKKYKIEICYNRLKKDEDCDDYRRCETLDVTELLIDEYKPVLEIKDSVFFYDNMIQIYNFILQKNYIKNTERKKESGCFLS